MVAEVRLPARSIERQVRHHEERESWSRVKAHANRIHLAVVADRPDIADHSAGELVSLAERRLAQLGGGDAA